MVYSPDGTHLASTSTDAKIRIWDLATGSVRVLVGHTAPVMAVAFSPDRIHLASASDDETVRVWDLATGSVRVLVGHTEAVSTVAFSRDGTHLASAGVDKTVRVWAGAGMAPSEVIEFICDRLRRDLTPDEREAYLPSARSNQRACP
ncbi:WD40 repeat domain-containing protein [Actinoplanes sp. L3-i22]|uniref:WD40 repeat domain-containing protein n=1 Tax=Actinoplanes sp. L3-i22 TaxID=2836373 RepID=UPI001C771F0A|nr:hypothetical protein [Actinoplanes sp. L3-i22]BCY11133.1 hypothetical protein L3i22_062210 [Actinoplanes sp. L3-i22]